jgi:hypothetical protein
MNTTKARMATVMRSMAPSELLDVDDDEDLERYDSSEERGDDSEPLGCAHARHLLYLLQPGVSLHDCGDLHERFLVFLFQLSPDFVQNDLKPLDLNGQNENGVVSLEGFSEIVGALLEVSH